MSPKLLNILLLVTPVALYFGVISPLYTGTGPVWVPEQSIQALKANNRQAEETLAHITLVENEVENLNKDFLSIDKEKIEKMKIMLPDSLDEVKLRNEIVSIANKSGVAISNLTVKKDERGGYKNLDFYTISFSMKTRYSVFKKIMADYDRNMRFYFADAILIKRQVFDDNVDQTGKPIVEDREALLIDIKFRVHSMK